jgi:Ca2+-binding EF-hand superfamily protein
MRCCSLVVLVVCVVGSALGKLGEPSGEHLSNSDVHKHIAAADTNSDGFLSKEELTLHLVTQFGTHEADKHEKELAKMWEIADADKNGHVVPEEFGPAYHRIHHGGDHGPTYDEEELKEEKAAFKELDTDGNGVIDPKEMRAHFGASENNYNFEHLVTDMYAAGDTNGDGKLDLEEVTQMDEGSVPARIALVLGTGVEEEL